jgi:hypothetical protein
MKQETANWMARSFPDNNHQYTIQEIESTDIKNVVTRRKLLELQKIKYILAGKQDYIKKNNDLPLNITKETSLIYQGRYDYSIQPSMILYKQ